MKLFQLLPKKLYDFACNLPLAVLSVKYCLTGKSGWQRCDGLCLYLTP